MVTFHQEQGGAARPHGGGPVRMCSKALLTLRLSHGRIVDACCSPHRHRDCHLWAWWVVAWARRWANCGSWQVGVARQSCGRHVLYHENDIEKKAYQMFCGGKTAAGVYSQGEKVGRMVVELWLPLSYTIRDEMEREKGQKTYQVLYEGRARAGGCAHKGRGRRQW